MTSIVTNTGKYNITDSLFESIKKNNPEIICEKQESKAEAEAEDLFKTLGLGNYGAEEFKKYLQSTLPPEVYDELMNMSYDISRQEYAKHISNVLKNYATQETNKNEILKSIDKMNNGVNDADDMILLNQIILNKGKISNGLEVNGVKLSSEDIRKRLNANKDLKAEYDKFKAKYKNDKNFKKEVNATIKQKNELNKYDKDDNYKPDNLLELLNSNRLKEEINSVEKIAEKIIARCSLTIRRTLGIMGGQVQAARSNYNTNNTNNTNREVGNEPLNYSMPLKSNMLNRATSFAALAGGGFRISPLFGSANDNENIGKALQYYKSVTQNKNDLSVLDDLMDSLVEMKSNEDEFNRKIENILADNTTSNNSNSLIFNNVEEVKERLLSMGKNFLHNVVYKLQIADDSKFEPIIRAVKFDKNLADKYDISNISNIKMFNVKEQNLVFKDRNTGAVVLILIAMPLLATGVELFNKAKKLTRHFNNIKA